MYFYLLLLYIPAPFFRKRICDYENRVMDHDEACKMHLTHGAVHNFQFEGCGCVEFLSPMHKKILHCYSKREGGHPAWEF